MWTRVKQYFLFYSFLGWLLEGCFNLVTKGIFKKPNFLHLPLKPMYGFGALSLLLGHRCFPKNIWLYACILPCLVEYCSGYWLEHHFSLRYWDYRKEFIQLKGYVCLKFALSWLVLAQVVIYLVQPILSCLLLVVGKWRWLWQKVERLFFLDVLLTYCQRRYEYKRVMKHG